jgi:succinyl-CoA synthetase alpha subunit
MILADSSTKVIVQGITGSQGFKHTCRMLAAGTNIVGGVNPRKAGEVVKCSDIGADKELVELPVFATCQDAVASTRATVSVVFVPPAFVKAAVVEAVDAGLKLVVVITEGIPLLDSAYFIAYANAAGTRIVGPNCPGIVTFPDAKTGITGANIGIIPDGLAGAGPIGLVSKSGTLTYQMLDELSDVGFTAAIGIGGDQAIGTSFVDALELFEQDQATEIIVLIGEIGGNQEELAAEYIQEQITKPVVAYIAGVSAPEGKTMGHAGAIIYGNSGTAASKRAALEVAGVEVGSSLSEVGQLTRGILVAMNL